MTFVGSDNEIIFPARVVSHKWHEPAECGRHLTTLISEITSTLEHKITLAYSLPILLGFGT